MFLGEKWFLENFEFFMNVLDILAKNKKVWSFDSKCLNVLIKFWFINFVRKPHGEER